MGWLSIGVKLVPYIVGAVEAVERFVTAKGQPKEDAAVGMIHSILQAVEVGADRDLLHDAEVNLATRKVMQAVVELQNVIASRKSGDIDG
jgi:hypothetical protein